MQGTQTYSVKVRFVCQEYVYKGRQEVRVIVNLQNEVAEKLKLQVSDINWKCYKVTFGVLILQPDCL